MQHFIRHTLNPAGYHGQGHKPPYFEGWHFKFVSADEQERWIIIPGLLRAADPAQSHAFIQVLDGTAGVLAYHTFPLEAFEAAPRGFDLRIGPNRFTPHSVALNIDDPVGIMRGEIFFRSPTPQGWPVSWLSPGSMGWYAWIPQMECYHEVISFDHGLGGQLTAGEKTIDFTRGRGYIEKNWGRAFPPAWIWYQSNHFRSPNICLTASLAIVPWLHGAFPGFIIGLLYGQKLYRFATYTGARVMVFETTGDEIALTVADRQFQLEMVARQPQGGLSQAPAMTGIDRRTVKMLDSRVWLRLSRRSGEGWQTIVEDEGRNAGFEVVGDVDRLRSMWIK